MPNSKNALDVMSFTILATRDGASAQMWHTWWDLQLYRPQRSNPQSTVQECVGCGRMLSMHVLWLLG